MFRSIDDGCVRVEVSASYVLTGSESGTVTCYTQKKWKKTAITSAPSPHWRHSELHKAMVTAVIANEPHDVVFTAGRDGVVTSCRLSDGEERRVLCRVSGEVTCLAYDSDRRRLFVAGDMLRYLSMGRDAVTVTSVPMALPAPLASISLSPCGSLIAMVSAANGDIRVQSLADATVNNNSAATQGSQKAAEVNEATETLLEFRGVKFSLKGLMSSARRKDDSRSFHTAWCALMPPDRASTAPEQPSSAAAAGVLDAASVSYLFVAPSADGVRVFRFLPIGHSLNKSTRHELLPVHTLVVDGLTDVSYVMMASPSSKQHRAYVSCVLGGSCTGDAAVVSRVVALKLQVKKFAVELTGSYDIPNGAKCVAVAVDGCIGGTGNLVVGSSEGAVALLEHCVAVPKSNLLYPPPPSASTAVPPTVTTTTALPTIGGAPQQQQQKQKKDDVQETTDKKKKEKPASQKMAVIVDDDEASESAADSNSSDSNSVLSSDAEADDDDNGSDRNGSLMDDLLQRNHGYVPGETKRKTALRQGSAAKKRDIIDAAEKQIRQPSYLDDEAEENDLDESGDDNGSDDDSNHNNNEEEDDELVAEDEMHMGDDASEFNESRSKGKGGGRGGDSSASQGPSISNSEKVRNYFFQPGATPVTDEAHGTCYLAYNAIGYVRCGVDGVFVGFHDVSRPVIKLLERGRILAAAMGHNGVACVLDRSGVQQANEWAEEQQQQDTEQLVLYFRSYVAYGAQSDWRVTLLPNEVPRCVAVGLQYVALATNFGLRIFSTSGLEKAVISFPQLIVCMTGANSPKFAQSLKYDEDPLAIAFHPCATAPLQLQVLNVAQSSSMLGPIPISVTRDDEQGDHFLEWLGWSEDGPLHTVDTAGVVRMHSNEWGQSWVPVFDPRHYTVDPTYRYWIWGVSDEYAFVYRSSKGSKEHAPLATTQGFPMDKARLCLPLLRNSGGDKGLVGRDRFLRATMKVNELKRTSAFYSEAIAKQDALHDKKVLELFQAALKEQQTTRAVDLVTTLQLLPSVEQAARIANEGGHHSVVQRLVAIVEMRHKLKLRRVCSLPLEEQVATDKEKDMLLKRLLLKERQQASTTTSGQSQGAGSAPQPKPSPVKVLPSTSQASAVEPHQAPVLPAPRRSVTFAPPNTDNHSGNTTTATVEAPSLPSKLSHNTTTTSIVKSPPVVAATGTTAAAAVPTITMPTLPKKQSAPFGGVAKPAAVAVSPASKTTHLLAESVTMAVKQEGEAVRPSQPNTPGTPPRVTAPSSPPRSTTLTAATTASPAKFASPSKKFVGMSATAPTGDPLLSQTQDTAAGLRNDRLVDVRHYHSTTSAAATQQQTQSAEEEEAVGSHAAVFHDLNEAGNAPGGAARLQTAEELEASAERSSHNQLSSSSAKFGDALRKRYREEEEDDAGSGDDSAAPPALSFAFK